MGFFAAQRAVAPAGYNRWLVPPAALALHLAIGQVYAFSVLKSPLVEHFDASLTSVAFVFSCAVAMLGCSAAFLGGWVARIGPRAAMAASTLLWVLGFVVAAAGVATGALWLVYLGYGVIGGIGLGIGYLAPVSTLMAWFPDRPGLATGMAVMGFGGGALVASPLTSRLLDAYGDSPTQALVPTLLTLAALYAVLMSAGTLVMRTPPPGYRVGGEGASAAPVTSSTDMTVKQAVRTPQFALLWFVLFAAAIGGIGILEQAAPMVQSYFGVTAAVAAGFVGVLSLANMAGRIGWSALSDALGRRLTYVVFLVGGAVAYTALAMVGGTSVALFVILAAVILSFYGGNFATIPAYLRDVFGSTHVSSILGRLLTAWAAAGVIGPVLINAITDSRARSGMAGAELYRPSMIGIVVVLVLGAVANQLVRPSRRAPDESAVAQGPGRDVAGAAAVAQKSGAAAVMVAEKTVVAPVRGMQAVVPVALWVLVAGLLAYGIVQTAIRASALFS